MLSGGKWLHISVEGKDAAKTIPPEGIILSYPFQTTTAASYEIWNRIGYEAARSPFEWRLDGGAWATVTPNAATTDLQQLQTWNPVAWLKLSTQPLTAGKHTIEIRLTPPKNKKGEAQNLNYASMPFASATGRSTRTTAINPVTAVGLRKTTRPPPRRPFPSLPQMARRRCRCL